MPQINLQTNELWGQAEYSKIDVVPQIEKHPRKTCYTGVLFIFYRLWLTFYFSREKSSAKPH